MKNLQQNQIQVFKNSEFGEIRTIQIDGQPWFVGKDVAKVLGYAKPLNALEMHVDGDDSLFWGLTDNLGRNQKTKLVNESGLYSLILSSKLPTAKIFKRWVTSEILPSIRKTGAYVTDELRKQLTSALIENADLKNNCQFLESEINELLPSAAYCNTILMCKEAIPVTVIAASYGMTAVAFNCLLHDLKIIRKVGETWTLYAKWNGNGYTVFRTFQIGENKSVRHLYWTEKGRCFLYAFLEYYGILPEVERGCL